MLECFTVRASVCICLADGPDVVTLTPPNDAYTENEGSYLHEIACSADCYPDCTYMWAKDGQTVSTNSILSLGNLSKEATGTYVCTVSNPGSSSIANANMVVNVRCKYQQYLYLQKKMTVDNL